MLLCVCVGGVLLLLHDHCDWWEIQGLAAELRESGIQAKGSRMYRGGGGECGLTINVVLLVNHNSAGPWVCVGQQPRFKPQEGWGVSLPSPPCPPLGPEVKVFNPAFPS